MGRLQRPLAGVFSAGRSDVNPHPGNETAYSTTSTSGGSPCTPGRAAKRELHRKLTFVSGAAGFGKTTLLSAWIADSDLPVAWLSLDEADSDPTRFPTYLVAAVRTIAPNIGDAVLADLLEKTSQPPPTESVLTTLLNDIATIPDNFVLIIDDYHTIDAKPVDAAVTFLLAHMPAHMHLVIATREDP